MDQSYGSRTQVRLHYISAPVIHFRAASELNWTEPPAMEILVNWTELNWTTGNGYPSELNWTELNPDRTGF